MLKIVEGLRGRSCIYFIALKVQMLGQRKL
jgi:hypothetical protein